MLENNIGMHAQYIKMATKSKFIHYLLNQVRLLKTVSYSVLMVSYIAQLSQYLKTSLYGLVSSDFKLVQI